MVVLDTVTLIYWTTQQDLLSHNAKQAIFEVERLIISSISIWEIAVKSKKGHIVLNLSLEEYIAQLKQLRRLEIRSVDVETWLRSTEFDWKHRDPADRVIVATATLLNRPLITPDRMIRGFYPQTIW